MTTQTPQTMTVLPLLEKEQFTLFLRLAMAMKEVIQGDEGGIQHTTNQDEQHDTEEMPHYQIA